MIRLSGRFVAEDMKSRCQFWELSRPYRTFSMKGWQQTSRKTCLVINGTSMQGSPPGRVFSSRSFSARPGADPCFDESSVASRTVRRATLSLEFWDQQCDWPLNLGLKFLNFESKVSIWERFESAKFNEKPQNYNFPIWSSKEISALKFIQCT